jgi:hypothetical protein
MAWSRDWREPGRGRQILAVSVTCALGLGGLGAQGPATPALDQLELRGVTAAAVTHAGRPAVRLLEVDGGRRGGMAMLAGPPFTNGTIELEVAGQRGPFAVPADRGFIGVAFRVRGDRETYEYVYLRPDNGRADDQVRRNHSTQYAAQPDHDFDRLRKESPERYESYVDLEPGVWTRMRVVIAGRTARLYVHDAPQPALVVSDLKLGTAGGGVALWIGPGTEGFFSAVRVTPSP